jgi:PIN domain nuclease of toxin-antitoxin system
MGRVVLDSSVLIAMFYDGDVHFDAVANKLRDEENTYMISTISLAETLTHASGKGSRQIELIVSRIQGAMTEIVDVDQEIAIAAAKIRVRWPGPNFGRWISVWPRPIRVRYSSPEADTPRKDFLEQCQVSLKTSFMVATRCRGQSAI